MPAAVIKLRPIKHDSEMKEVQPNINSIYEVFETLLQYLEDSEKIIVLCLGIVLPDQNLFPTTAIECFEDDFKFIARTLGTRDKIIFVIISTVMGDYVIPLIHKHYCIEKMYLYGDTNDESSSCQWSSISEKINGPYSDFKQLSHQITNDFNTTIRRLLRWDRSSDLFTMLYTQQLENRYSLTKISNDVAHNECIVIFHCDNQTLFYAEGGSSPFNQFAAVNKCVQFINEHSQLQIFLVISGEIIPLEIKSIFDSRQIYGIYFFRTNQLNYSINTRKVSGLFDRLEELANQLDKDILFFRQQSNHTSRINMCPSFDREKELISQLNPEQMTFLALQLFIDILPEIPSFSANNEQENSWEPNLEFWQMMLKLHQINKLDDLFILQNQLADIHKRVLESPKILKPVTVYLAKIVSHDTREIIQCNSDGYLNIGMYLLATRSLLTARSIARQAANNGLVSVLFEIEVVNGTRLQTVNLDRVVLRLGSVFRLISIKLAPDGVWYVKTKSVDEEFQLIKEQFQLEIGIRLSWLTYGNYLSFLNHFEQGKNYFKYLLDKLPLGHIGRPSIYNNMGLMYTMNHEEDRANHFYNLALDCVKSISPDAITNEREDLSYDVIPTTNMILPRDLIDHSTVLGDMGNVYYRRNNRTKALEFYKKAFESATDQRCSQYYQQKILTLSKT